MDCTGEGAGSEAGGARARRLAYERRNRARKLAEETGVSLDEALAIVEARADRRARHAAAPRATIGNSAMSEDSRERKRREVREQSARRRARRKLDPEWVLREAKRRRAVKQVLKPEQLARKLEQQRIRRRSRIAPKHALSTGSVLATAAASEWRDVLAAITASAPKWDDRDEVIAEAALLVLEGMSVAEALAGAKRSVSRSAAPYRQMRQIEECNWL